MTENLHFSFESQLYRDHPPHAGALLETIRESQPPVSVRTNPFKWDEHRHTLPAESEARVPWEPQAWYLKTRPVFTLDPLLHAGAYYVQEASSMWIGEAMRQLLPAIRANAQSDQPLRMLDLCAAPGGKSTHLASVIPPTDLLVSNEVHRARARILLENITKWGNNNVVVTSGEAVAFAALGSWFDAIVVDAPCSGEGLFRRDPAARNEWSPEAVQLCAVRQRQILQDIWPALKPGGYLIYSTCTFNRKENDEQLMQLLASGEATLVSIDTGNLGNGIIRELPARAPGGNPENGIEKDHLANPSEGINPVDSGNSETPEKNAVSDGNGHPHTSNTNPQYANPNETDGIYGFGGTINPQGGVVYRCFPGMVKGEGFTFAIVQKKSDAARQHPSSSRKGRLQPSPAAKSPWIKALKTSADVSFFTDESTLFAIDSRFTSLVRQLDSSVFVLSAGTALGDEFKPAHGLAMSHQLERSYFPEIELPVDQALNYLRRESIRVDARYKGWVLLTWLGLPLGFGKAVQGRINNHYPQEWRIRHL